MRFLPALAMRIVGGMGAAAAASAGGAGLYHQYLQSKNNTVPPDQAAAVSPILTGSLNNDQKEMAKFLWKQDMQKELIDYEDNDSWIQKAKNYSVKSEKWPGDIIFISDKSDGSLAGLLREKCYSVSRWFVNKSQATLDDNNQYLKSEFKNVKDSFSIENLKELCSTGGEDMKQYSISSIVTRTLSTLLSEPNSNSYTCSNDSIVPTGHWMEEIYNLKKDNNDNPNACNIVKGNIIVVITYGNGSKKYEIWKSQKTGNSGYINVPREDWIFYSSLEELPGFSEMFKRNSR